MTHYNWKPIEPLSDTDRKIDLAAMRPLYESWHAAKARLEESSRVQLADFDRRLIRRLSVESGIVERLYDLDRGPSRLIDVLRDQEGAIQLVVDAVKKKRELTKDFLHELHANFTRHQDASTAVDPLGNRHDVPLPKGRFKEQANNPKGRGGTLHEYCPPSQVDSEIENLLRRLNSYESEDPIVVAAWLHHRFLQIHPYNDGNGRVARAITTMILLRAELLPLVVDRTLKMEYIKALELADQTQLTPLAKMFARLERGAILQALSVDADGDADADIRDQRSLTAGVVRSLADKFRRRRIQRPVELRQVNSVALELRTKGRTLLEQSFEEMEATLRETGQPEMHILDGGPDRGNDHWFRFQVVKSAKDAGKLANLEEAHYFIRGSITIIRERLSFVVSFHHVGRELNGIMEATAFFKLDSYEDSEDGESVQERFSLCSTEPFVFTYKTKSNEIMDGFSKWLDAALAAAVKHYGDRL